MKPWSQDLEMIQYIAQKRFGTVLEEIASDQEIFELAFTYLFDLMPGATQLQFNEEEDFVSFCWKHREKIVHCLDH